MLIDKLAKVLQVGIAKLPRLDEMCGQPQGRAVEDAIDELADHAAGRIVGRDGGGPLVTPLALLAADELFFVHDAEHRRHGRRGDLAVRAERRADIAKRERLLAPQHIEDLQLPVCRVVGRVSGHVLSAEFEVRIAEIPATGRMRCRPVRIWR